jgi:hypothetical protein
MLGCIHMPSASHSPFVESVAQEFRERYPEHILSSDSDATSLWFECRSGTPSRALSPLAFGISNTGVTVAFDGLTCPKTIHPPMIEAETVRREAFALFDDLISERKISISFWQGDECVGVEFVPHQQVQAERAAWSGYAVRVRSWTGKHDHDYPA